MAETAATSSPPAPARVWRPLLGSFGWQSVNLGGKLILAWVLAFYLSVEDFGTFGLLAATLALATQLVSLRFSAFSSRELIRAPREEVPVLLRDQGVVFALLYVGLGLPVTALAGLLLPGNLLPWFYAVLVAENLTTEAHILFVALGRASHAALLLFVGRGAWGIALALLWLARPDWASIPFALGCWVAGGLLALALALVPLSRLDWRRTRLRPVDWTWIRRGLCLALPFLASALAFYGMTYATRFLVDHFGGREQVGIYTFYAYGHVAIVALLEVGVLAIFQARVVGLYQRGQLPEYRRTMRQALLLALALGGALGLLALVAVRPLIDLMNKPVYGTHLDAFAIVVTTPLVSILATMANLALYVRQRDQSLLFSSLAGLLAVLGLGVVLIPLLGLLGAALAALGGHTLVAAVAWVLLLRCRAGEAFPADAPTPGE